MTPNPNGGTAAYPNPQLGPQQAHQHGDGSGAPGGAPGGQADDGGAADGGAGGGGGDAGDGADQLEEEDGPEDEEYEEDEEAEEAVEAEEAEEAEARVTRGLASDADATQARRAAEAQDAAAKKVAQPKCIRLPSNPQLDWLSGEHRAYAKQPASTLTAALMNILDAAWAQAQEHEEAGNSLEARQVLARARNLVLEDGQEVMHSRGLGFTSEALHDMPHLIRAMQSEGVTIQGVHIGPGSDALVALLGVPLAWHLHLHGTDAPAPAPEVMPSPAHSPEVIYASSSSSGAGGSGSGAGGSGAGGLDDDPFGLEEFFPSWG